MRDEKERPEEVEEEKVIHVPVHLKHRPILGLEQYEQADGNKAGDSEAKGLSIGMAQWNDEESSEVSAKIWRHTGEKWSRQSEEMALHRIVDLTILIARTRLLFKRFKPTKLGEKPGYPKIDEISLQGEQLPVSACIESETFDEDVINFEKAMSEEEIILRERFDVLTGILTETNEVIRSKTAEISVTEADITKEETPSPAREQISPPSAAVPQKPAADTRWYQRISLKDLILTTIAFISIMTAIFFAGKVRDFNDLSLGPNDIIITEAADDTVDLWIRQKNGIESVMITKQIIDYGNGTGHYTCLDPGHHLASEGEKRILEGIFFGADEKGYPLVDSTTERHPRLGAAYHLQLPREILYQTGDGNYHAMALYHGSPFTITAFRKDFADYTGEYRINPFTLHAENWLTDEPYYGTYSLEVLAEGLKEDVTAMEAQLRAEFDIYRQDQDARLTALRNEGVVVATDLQDEIAALEQRLRIEYAADMDDLLASADEVIVELKAADEFMKESALELIDGIYTELEASVAGLEDSLTERITIVDDRYADELDLLREEVGELIANMPEPEIITTEVTGTVDDTRVTALEDDLKDLENALEKQKEKLDAQYNSFTSYFETVNGRLDENEDAVSALETSVKEQSSDADAMYIRVGTITEELAKLRNAVMMFNNMGVFGSIRPISRDVVKMVLELKGENDELTQQEAMEALSRDGYQVTSYEMFLIFSVYFNEYKL